MLRLAEKAAVVLALFQVLTLVQCTKILVLTQVLDLVHNLTTCTGGSSSISTSTSTGAQSDDGSTWQRLRHARCKGTIQPSANLLVRIIIMMIAMIILVIKMVMIQEHHTPLCLPPGQDNHDDDH